MKKIVLLLIVILNSISSNACMCSATTEFSSGERNVEWWNKSEYIFIGTLDSTITPDKWSQELFFTTSSKFKGEIEDNINFYSPMFGSSCEWDLQGKEGKEFIIYGYINDKGILVSHFCQGSRQILNEKEIETQYDSDYKLARTILKQKKKFIEDISKSKNGLVKTYYSNGNRTAIGHFENYKPIGYWKYYSFDGQITSEGKYSNFEKSGIWIENIYKYESITNSNNEVEYQLIYKGFIKGKYSNGEKIGVWKSYNTDGKLIKSE